MRMIYFTSSIERREVAVDPEKVLYVCVNATGSCNIHFGKDCFIRVQGQLHEIVDHLEQHKAAASRAELELDRAH